MSPADYQTEQIGDNTNPAYLPGQIMPLGIAPIVPHPTSCTQLPFPQPETDEYTHWHEQFRRGNVILGETPDGELVIRLDTEPHTLISGGVGSGKTSCATLFVYGALTNPDIADVVILSSCPDFAGAADRPNVIAYTCPDRRPDQPSHAERVRSVVKLAHEELTTRRQIMANAEARSLAQLRSMATAGLAVDPRHTKRLLVVMDDADTLLERDPRPSLREAQEGARQETLAMLLDIAMMGRTSEVNLITVSSRVGADTVGLSMRNLYKSRVLFRSCNPYTRQRVIDTQTPVDLPRAGDGLFQRGSFGHGGEPVMFCGYYLPLGTDTIPGL